MADENQGNERWLKTWQNDNIHFHLDDVNPFLKKFIDHLVPQQPPPQPHRILVPLCGKSVDMMFLYKLGLSVVGIELSPIACESFFKENNLSVTKDSCCGFNIWKHDKRLVIFEGDLFKATADIIGGVCTLHWDRGAFVALPTTMQSQYANHIKSLLSNQSKSLMECLEYDTSKRTPPPNCIPFDRVEAAFGDDFVYNELSRVQSDDLEMSKKLEGVTHVLYSLVRK